MGDTPTIGDLQSAMESIAPTRLAESWDNVGLLVGDAAAELSGVSLCIDLTADVLAEARQSGANAVVAYHPPIFKDVKTLHAGDVVFDAIRQGVAVYSPHTALDVAPGGTNDVLADLLYLTHRKPLAPKPASKGDLRLVTFVPADHADDVAKALFDAWAGSYGDYDSCAFRTTGTGSFRGLDGSNPAIGQPGQLETVKEVRLETTLPAGKADEVVAALRQTHPYEEVAFDLLRREPDPAQVVGLGRIGDFDEPVPRDVLFGRIRRELNVGELLVAGPVDGEVKRIACCAGSCGDLLDSAAKQGAELYVTGELKHHDALRAAKLGLTAVCVLHSNSERPTLDVLRRRLSDLLPASVEVAVSHVDRDPFVIL
ncbi:MAG: Nif3-like dinuclear metal center hexameric protein [Planctomycetota bacterium]